LVNRKCIPAPPCRQALHLPGTQLSCVAAAAEAGGGVSNLHM
jgi:hypothetical protein